MSALDMFIENIKNIFDILFPGPIKIVVGFVLIYVFLEHVRISGKID
ncbi:MAG: hypothetical protein N4A54_04095 [Peptostreptococcaceae bacterium]|jgi:hypothetical protein|nr:hypothetical protein [Peptostreptococcaceae bacterium]